VFVVTRDDQGIAINYRNHVAGEIGTGRGGKGKREADS
jgi:hypothetical protein